MIAYIIRLLFLTYTIMLIVRLVGLLVPQSGPVQVYSFFGFLYRSLLKHL